MPDRNERFSRDEFEDWSDEIDRKWRDDEAYRGVRSEAQDAIRRSHSPGSQRGSNRFAFMNATPKPALFVTVLILGIASLVLATFLLVSHLTAPAPATNPQTPPAAAAPQPADQPASSTDSPIPGLPPQPTKPAQPEDGILAVGASITLRLALAALLTSLMAYRPRKDLPIIQRNPYVAQTQILLAVVASALMMIVADNAARAFGIFAAASLVRFRTNIRDPKEITVLLVSLGIGLATGVGKFEVAIILALFILLMLWVLEYYEPVQVFRALELTVSTRKVDETDEALRKIFERHKLTTELRITDREDAVNPLGKIVYYVNISPRTSTDKLSEEIFAADSENIDGVRWDQKKSQSYLYH